MKRRRIKNWFTAMAVLFTVMAVIVLLRDLALFGPELFMERAVNAYLNNEKISFIMFGIAGILFAVGLVKSEKLYKEG